MAKGASRSDILTGLFRQAVADTLPDLDPLEVDAALLHWRLSAALNAATFIVAPRLRRCRAALVLRQAKVNRTGALLRRSMMVVELGWDGVVSGGRLAAPSADVFAEEPALRRFLEQPDELSAHGGEVTEEELAFRSWRPIEPERGAPWAGVIGLDLLPGCAWGLRSVEERCRLAARRIACESRAILLGAPPRPAWGQRAGAEDDPGIRRFVAILGMTAFAVLRITAFQAVRRFAALLDAEAVAALAILPAPRIDHYNFFAAPLRPAGKPRRLQALATYPLLADALAARPEFGEVIDRGRELGAALRRCFGAKPRALKSLAGLPPAVVGDDATLPDAAQLLTALSAVPPAWYPATPEAWRAFRGLLGIRGNTSSVTWTATRMRELGPDWERSRARLGGFQRLHDLKDFRWALFSHLLAVPLHAAVDHWHVSMALPDTLRTLVEMLGTLLDRRPLLKQLDASDLWHRRQGEIMAVTGGGERRSLHWMPLTEPYASHRGPVVVPLVSSGALRDEGEHLHHCVGGYDDPCCWSGHHIVSVRTSDGGRLSTAELVFTGEGGLVVLQHRAAQNDAPGDDAVAALEEYIDGIASGAIPCDCKALDEDLQRRSRTRRSRNATGLDCHDPAAVTAVWEVYRPMLPPPWRRMTVDEFYQASGLAAAAVVEQAVPLGQRPQARQEEYWDRGRRRTRLTLPWVLWPGTEEPWRALLAQDRIGDAENDARLLELAYDNMPRVQPRQALGNYRRDYDERDHEERLMAEWGALMDDP